MIPIVSIVGTSDSGKTTLIEKLVPELNRRGYRVATVKHDVHGFEVDREGKDSWRHKQAGAHTVVISSTQKLVLIRDVDHDAELAELRDKYIQDVDIILSEGFKRNSRKDISQLDRRYHRTRNALEHLHDAIAAGDVANGIDCGFSPEGILNCTDDDGKFTFDFTRLSLDRPASVYESVLDMLKARSKTPVAT